MKKFGCFVSIILFVFLSYGGVIEVPNIKIKQVVVEGDRDDTPMCLENKIVIKATDLNGTTKTFGGKLYLHFDVGHDAANSILAQALLAAQNGYTVTIAYNSTVFTEHSYEIAYIIIEFP